MEELKINKIRWILIKQSRREALLRAQESMIDSDVIRSRVRLWADIQEYRESALYLQRVLLLDTKAHSLWQLYFVENPVENTLMPLHLVDYVEEILWRDINGLDSRGLVKQNMFDAVEYCS